MNHPVTQAAGAPAERPAPTQPVKPNPFLGRTVLTVQEVARQLVVTEQHVCNFIEEGTLHAINVGGGARKLWRIPIESYTAFLKDRSSIPSPP